MKSRLQPIVVVSGRTMAWRGLAALACIVVLGSRTAGATGFFDPQVLFSNLQVVPRDAKTATIRFDVAWEDASWRHEINHGAAWVFFKARANKGAPWQHVRLAADRVLNPTGYGQRKIPPATTAGQALTYFEGRTGKERIGGIEGNPDTFPGQPRDTRLEFLVPDGDDGFTGVFLRRAANGKGAISARGVTVVADLTSLEGIADIAKAEIRAFGLEMVYAAGGPFYLGTGGTELNSFYTYTDGTDNSTPYRVTGPVAIPTGQEKGRLWARGAEPEDGGKIPAAFPNGYSAFYCMFKHISPRRYAEFLNTLPVDQAEARFDSVERRHGARVLRSGQAPDYTYTWANGGARAGVGIPHLSWADGAAYSAWAGLRPMTELEIEKLVRGPRLPIPDEVGPSYWGASAFQTWQWDAVKGWEQQGERAVTVGNATGRRFQGTHGNGSLRLPADWPQDDAVGSGIRCTWYPELDRARASDRLRAAVTDTQRRHKFRAVRTAPLGAVVGDQSSVVSDQ